MKQDAHSAVTDDLLDERDSSDLASSNNMIPNSLATKTGLLLFVAALLPRAVFLFVTPNNGVDAWARYLHAVDWLKHPASLPTATSNYAWLPLHFWLLGGAIWLWNSEWSARILTALLGALTILPYWGAMKRAFAYKVALAASVAFAIFGFHVGYSVTTSSEVPTIFFISLGLYGWVRFYLEQTWRWALMSGLFLGAGCLCRFEAWLVPPVLALVLLNHSDGWKSLWSDRRAWWNAIRFAIPALAGAVGWMLFSWKKWGDPMMLLHRTIAENLSVMTVFHYPTPVLMTFIPLALSASLSPLIAGLAVLGIVVAMWRGTGLAKGIALLSLTLFTFNYYSTVLLGVNQAKYTLAYSWLFLPFAFRGVQWITSRRHAWTKQWAPWFVISFFVVWQAGIVFGAVFASPSVADKLAIFSPALPPRVEIRELVVWLKAHHSASDAVLLDEYKNESAYILRFSGIDLATAFAVEGASYRDPNLVNRIGGYVRQRRPSLFIVSPDGPIGRALSLPPRGDLEIPSLNLHLHREWEGEHWVVFAIEESYYKLLHNPPQDDHEAGDMKEGAIDRERAVVTHDQAPEISEPGVGAFYDPPPLISS